MRILFLANVTPWPPRSGVHLRILRLIERIAERHEVTIGCHVWRPSDWQGVAELNRRGIKTVGGEVFHGSLRRHAVLALQRALRGVPPETAQYASPALQALVQEGAYDLLHIEESLLAPYAASVPHDRRRRRVLTLHNLHFVQDRRIARIEPAWVRRGMRLFNARWMRAYEPRVASTFDRVILVSDVDRNVLQAVAPALRLDVIPNGVDTTALQPLPPADGPPTLLFVGSLAYRPCIDGVQWLVRDIVPRLRRIVPALEVLIVGQQPHADVRALASPGVQVLGDVEEITPFYARATLSVVPIRAGGGSRLKILEAMALGRAVVSTTLGAEGLQVTPDVHLAIADTTSAMTDTLAALLMDGQRRIALTQAARALVERQYDWGDLATQQMALYEHLCAAP